MKTFIVIGTLIALAATGCGDKPSNVAAGRPLIKVEEEDAEMTAAIAKAQTTLTNFITALRAPQANQNYFLIKAQFTAGEFNEHLWVADPTFDGKLFRGVLANQPEKLPGLTFKQAVEIPPSQVSDWMYVQDGFLIGGYTSRVLRSRMTEQERRDRDARNPYRYE